MKLKDCKTIFGESVELLKKRYRRYTALSAVIYLLDVLVILGGTSLMFLYNVQAQWYGILLVIVCLAVGMLMQLFLRDVGVDTYEFYRKFRFRRVEVRRFNASVEELNKFVSELFGVEAGCSDITELKSLICSLCLSNRRKAIKVASKFQELSADTGEIEYYVVMLGATPHFVDFVKEYVL